MGPPFTNSLLKNCDVVMFGVMNGNKNPLSALEPLQSCRILRFGFSVVCCLQLSDNINEMMKANDEMHKFNV